MHYVPQGVPENIAYPCITVALERQDSKLMTNVLILRLLDLI